jgi:galactose mutarotase-like enzyme
MITSLKNENITIQVKSLGAELTSLKKNNDSHEYIWTGDSKFWGGQSPVLFPIIGSLSEGTMTVDGKSYSLGNHGFARREEFKLIESTEDKLVYSLKYNEKTMAMYPYKFDLQLTYTLDGSSINISYKVINLDDKSIYFQLGTHPGFNCPMGDNLSLSDYSLIFSENENAKRYYCDAGNLLIENREELVLDESVELKLNPEMFYDGAFLFRDIKSKEITLKTEKDSKFVKVSNENFPYLGIWQPKDAPFLCIEPWHGLAEPVSFTGEFKDKELVIELKKDAIHSASLKFTV